MELSGSRCDCPCANRQPCKMPAKCESFGHGQYLRSMHVMLECIQCRSICTIHMLWRVCRLRHPRLRPSGNSVVDVIGKATLCVFIVCNDVTEPFGLTIPSAAHHRQQRLEQKSSPRRARSLRPWRRPAAVRRSPPPPSRASLNSREQMAANRRRSTQGPSPRWCRR
eukprot:267403-Pleurochrysis_carterae.AAC.1